MKNFKKILDFARLIIHNDIQFVDITDGAKHYHADYVRVIDGEPKRERQRLVITSFIVGRKNEHILLRPSSYQRNTDDV